ncbi:hypothetical protein SEA_KROMP_73 [Streptomyces phage Kromp]|uniref:Uncharacterized protein n=1 Tax=Streptomyces phage Kromp TaxID=2315619 RepID=A0A386KBI7_9CAUD|nr:hypothetical protein SEA_KROMP_73 [Streptomyces phage Kromp]
MDDLVQWLRAQLDEDEAKARACPGNGEWTASDIAIYGTGLSSEVREHMAEHEPARVLREIEAKRQVITKYTTAVDRMAELAALIERVKAEGQSTLMPEMERATAIHRRDVLSEVLRLFASPYADRPGYRDEWRP